jgi:hypothetical protein
MKTKILIIGLFLGIILTSALNSQTDSVKSYYINKVKVSPGKYYELGFFNGPPETGKLVGVNENTVLIFANNSIAEYYISDIISMKEIEPEYIINSTNYSGRHNKSTWSISTGYTNNKREDYYYYYYENDVKGNKGFNIQGDMVVKLSDYFGFRADLNYMHTFGTTEEAPYNDPYYYYTYKTEFGDNNILALKTEILVGSIGDYNIFNFFVFLGGGMLYTFPFEVKEYSNYQSYYQNYSDDRGDELELGFVGGIRFGYKINKKYSLFIEPSFHWWSGNTDRTININGGISFDL